MFHCGVVLKVVHATSLMNQQVQLCSHSCSRLFANLLVCHVLQEELAEVRSTADASSSAEKEVQELQGKLTSLTQQLLKQQEEQDAKAAEVKLDVMLSHPMP